MLYQLQTGKTIDIDPIKLINMSNEELQNYVADDRGVEINNPFYKKGAARTLVNKDEEIYDELSDTIIIEGIPDIDDIEEIDLNETIDD